MSASRLTRWSWCICAVLVAAATAGWVFVRAPTDDGVDETADAQTALANRDHGKAARIAARFLRESPGDPEMLMVAAIAAAESGRFRDAVTCCERIAESSDRYPDAQCMAGNLYLSHLGDPALAEAAYRRALDVAPDHRTALERLSHLLSLQTRTWELIPVQLRLMRRGIVTLPIVLSLVQGDLLYPDAELLARFRAQQPEQGCWLLAQSRQSILQGDLQAAEELLRAALEADPGLIEAHARLGQVLDSRSETASLREWRSSLPDAALAHPLTWITLGRMAQRADRPLAAVRCYLEAGQRDAASLSACYLLGKQLAALGKGDEAEPFLNRAERLEKYRRLFDHGPDGLVPITAELLRAGFETAESLGLNWEADALARLASGDQQTPPWAQAAIGRLSSPQVDFPLVRTAPQADLFAKYDLSEYPLPDSTEALPLPSSARGSAESSPVRFENVAETLGIDFEFDNGVDRRISGAQRPYDFTGGGIAILDYDADGWPDLFCSQGCRLDDRTARPLEGDSDVIYRNLRGHRFDDISVDCLPAAVDYSQGVSVGDVNNDGFTDLFVANLGPNRLLINNGDGTFADASAHLADDAARWTTSCVICDLNGDGSPDLYSVNYLAGDIVARVCRDESGRINSCAPQSFPASQDQLHISDGSGRFFDATKESGIGIPNGKGLGVVAVDVDADRRLDLFVANDGVPNFLLENRCTDDEATFASLAMPRGVAVNRDGLSEACMGIVAEDLNLDGRIDLFVTNFMDETNTLYEGTPLPGYFDDRTSRSGLGRPSLRMLGFGAQAIDGDLDGLPDLIVVNGHVDDFTDRGVPYQMAPQYFQNLGGLNFALQEFGDADEYFRGTRLGRSVARLDWNRDGRDEVAIGHLDVPLALLRNMTLSHGGWVCLHLRATRSQRDAIGALVKVVASPHVWQRRLVAGDGYQASNQRVLLFGLADHDAPVDVHVTWPSGHHQVITDVDILREYFLVEGRQQPYVLPR